MYIRPGSLVSRIARCGVIGAFVFGSVQPVVASDHLPIVDINPTASFTTTEDGINTAGGPKNPAPNNGDIGIFGTATLPLLKGLSISYDRIGGGAFDSALSPFIVGGHTIYPGGSRDLLQNYRIDYHFNRFNIEGGLGSRYRICCPADSLEWHKGFLGISYATPPIALLNHGFFVFDITGNSVHYNPSVQTLASLPPGLALKGQIYTTSQSATAVIPLFPKYGVRTATTYLWGALDYPEHGPFPQYYGIFIYSGTKQINQNLGLTITEANVKQRIQGYPFPAPFSIRTSALTVTADFHLDFNRILAAAPPTTPGRSTQPGVPGGPGGPAQVGPTQGGTVSPSPSPGAMMPGASPAPMMPGASPAPMMPGASPAPMMPGASPAPMMPGASPAPMMSPAPTASP